MAPIETSEKENQVVNDAKQAGEDAVATKALNAPQLSEQDQAAAVRQLKHYFSDANLTFDKFMRTSIQKNDGWIDIDTLAKFNRVKQLFPPVEGSDKSLANVAALKAFVKSHLSELSGLELNESEQAIRRTEPFVASDDWYDRTIVVTGFPRDMNTSSLIDDATEFFGQFGTIELVRRRINAHTKKFKGSILVQFATTDEAKQLAEKDSVEFEQHTLGTAMVRDYHDQKVKAGDFISEDIQQSGQEYPSFIEWKKSKRIASLGVGEGKSLVDNLVVVKGLPESAGLADIKTRMNEEGIVAFVDFNKAKRQAIVNFKEAIAAKVIEKYGGEDALEIAGEKVEVSAATKELEDEYLASAKRFINHISGSDNNNNSNNKSRKRFARGKSGNRGGKRQKA
ncbi:hypothetical protein EV182_004315 [Spiromyces aspiralis]|uniref:Uncharacterized protein n=1 Tax=Spiromyces aspiralis TaxID=68401 RepID=A0ACC1HP72_9FUNG|nr:hypothetical protein EV182_004315 [Spiromyces aspiralis]